VFIETVIHLTKTPEFDDYTGFKDRLIRGKKDFSDYESAFKYVINEALRTGQVLKPKEILKNYQEEEKAKDAKMRVEAKEKESEIRKRFTTKYFENIFRSGKNPEAIQTEVNKTKEDFRKIWDKYGRYIGESTKDIWAIVNTAENAAKNDILNDTIWNNL
jgi:hypothetical protein